jgi:hypothetical protein
LRRKGLIPSYYWHATDSAQLLYETNHGSCPGPFQTVRIIRDPNNDLAATPCFSQPADFLSIFLSGNMRDDSQRSRKIAALIADRDPNSHISMVNSENFQNLGPFLAAQFQNYTMIHLGVSIVGLPTDLN